MTATTEKKAKANKNDKKKAKDSVAFAPMSFFEFLEKLTKEDSQNSK